MQRISSENNLTPLKKPKKKNKSQIKINPQINSSITPNTKLLNSSRIINKIKIVL